MRKLFLLCALMLATAPLAMAQSTDDYSKIEFFGGFSHNRIDTGISDPEPGFQDIVNEREGFNGFNLAVTGNVTRYVGVKFDFSGHYKNRSFPVGTSQIDVNSSLYNVLGGIQLKDNSKETRFKPFAHALAGIARGRSEVDVVDEPAVCIALFPSPCPIDFTQSDTGFAGAFGGGLDIRAGSRIDIRAVQFDYNPTKLFDGTQHNFRIGFGVVIH